MRINARLVVAAMSVMLLTGVGMLAQTGTGQTSDVSRPGPGITNPVLVKEVKPTYTPEALKARIQGVVELEVTVLPDGSIDPNSIVITKSLDKDFGLDDMATAAAKEWKFQPGTRKDTRQPVAVRVNIEMHFSANDQRAEIQFDSMGVDFGPWLDSFMRTVKQNWLEPEGKLTIAGHVVVRLHVHKNGTLTDIKVTEPLSIASFNVAAVDALKASNPGIALPSAYPVDPMPMTVIFRYNERAK